MRFLSKFVITSVFCVGVAHTFGCSSDSKPVDADPFDTFQMCYDDHHVTEGFGVQKALEICCIDHPIGGAKANTVCGDTAASCTTYVNANVSPAPAASDVSTACSDYVISRAG
jgi:hypothetical protein